MCRCTPSIRTPFCGKLECVAPISQHLPPQPWGHTRIGIEPPKSITPPSFDDMRKQILAASRDSALINSCLRTAEMLGLSGEDRYVVLSYYALVELERQYRVALNLAMTHPPAMLVARCDAKADSHRCTKPDGHAGDHQFAAVS